MQTINTTTFKQRLEEEKGIVVNRLKDIGAVKDVRDPENWIATPQDINNDSADPNEVADRIDSYEGNNALVQEFEGRLREIDAALGKIEKGTYGVCEVCGATIEEDRLMANPAAKTCKAHMH